ncbi:J domain-containing protein [Neorhizobium tomejilense]|uniref:J domain-containing protein n=1 Tax=Neorhizobium tomejilense TaxID=2093828 RepID=UPI000CF92F6B|nr:J domain-containing protein [Neorhizobium tomejilense]
MIPYPLQWPEHMPRFKAAREAGQFRTTLVGAINNVKDSLKRFAADSGKPLANVVISSNVTLGADKPSDPGVAVWFVWDGMTVCIPVDRYAKVEANLQAIHHIVEARRTELRHGTLALVRATFTGFAALPAPQPASKRSWREVFGYHDTQMPTATELNRTWRDLAGKRHPDAGGSHDLMSELNEARAAALREIKG